MKRNSLNIHRDADGVNAAGRHTVSVAKFRKGQKRGDYSDPGWYKHPAGTVAYEFTGSLPDPARFKADASPGHGSMPSMAKPSKEVEVKVRKPVGGHTGH